MATVNSSVCVRRSETICVQAGTLLFLWHDMVLCLRRANRDSFLRSAAGQYLVQFSDLTFKQQIGDGSVGRVHLGKWQVGSRPHSP